MNSPDTIFALSSGPLPAGLAVVRISGPAAGMALTALAGALPVPRMATLRRLRDPADRSPLDDAIVLWFPGPASATGEDTAELHLHGGRAVAAAVLAVLGRLPGLRPADPGEFTRRGFDNGRMDLTAIEGLGDLLRAETEGQRRAALAMAEGGLARAVAQWQDHLLGIAARVEAILDFDDEDDVAVDLAALRSDVATMAHALQALIAAPPAERLHDGLRVVIAGPPNAGKSTLLNALVGREAAIVSAIAGTTRDVIEAPVVLGGIPFLFADTAGLRDAPDEIEAIGVARAEARITGADILLWLGDPAAAPDHPGLMPIAAKQDIAPPPTAPATPVSAKTGTGLPELIAALIARAQSMLPPTDAIALNQRQRSVLIDVVQALSRAARLIDPLLLAEELRQARLGFDRLTGRAGVEDLLDRLFSGFCIGK